MVPRLLDCLLGTGLGVTYLPDDPAWVDYACGVLDEQHRLTCCDCGDTVPDDGRYDCRCTQGDTNA